MTDLERRLVGSLHLSADLLEEWIAEEARLPNDLERQGGAVVATLRYLAGVVDVTGKIPR